jgi:CRP-like cAMP-binding protein
MHLGHRGPGELVGEISVLCNRHCSATVHVNGTASLFRIPKEALLGLFTSDGGFGRCVLRNQVKRLHRCRSGLARLHAERDVHLHAWPVVYAPAEESSDTESLEASKAFLRVNPAFQDLWESPILNPDALRRLLDSRARLCKGDTVMRQDGRPAREVFLVQSGRLLVTKRESESRQAIAGVLESGDWFNVSSVLAGVHQPLYTVGADEPATVLRIPDDLFLALLEDGRFRLEVLVNLSRQLLDMEERRGVLY